MRTRRIWGLSSVVFCAAAWLGACGGDDPAPASLDADGGTELPPPPSEDSGLETSTTVEGRAKVVVEHYDYELDVTNRTALTKLRLRVETSGKCVSLPFRAQAAESVTFDGLAATDVSTSNGALVACQGAPRGLVAGTTSVLATRVRLPTELLSGLQINFSTTKDVAGGPFTYMLSWVGQCDRFGPCDNAPNLFATYHFAVDHPAGARVLCPGTIVAQPNGTRTDCDFTFGGGPTYSTFGLMVGERWIESSLGTQGNVKLSLFDLDGANLADSLDPSRTRGMLGFLVSKLGPYPYGTELRFVAGPTVWAGFEHPGNISLAETLSGTSTEHTAFHEMAHQWAGDQTTLAATKDFVWKEAMAEYLAFAYESTFSEPRALATARVWKDASRGLDHHPVPVEELPVEEFYGSAYGPGPLVLFRQLEVRYSRDAVLGALATVLGKPRSLSLQELRAALEAKTGAKLATYFEDWLSGTGKPSWPTVRVTKNTTANGPVAIVLTPKKKGRGLKFVVRLEGANAAQKLDVTVDTGIDGSGATTLSASPGFVTTKVTVDPDAQALVFEEGTPGAFAPDAPAPVRPWLAPARTSTH